jgi:hypothetical protein
LINEQKEYID